MDVNGVQIIDIDEHVTIGMDAPIEIGEHLPTGTISITENGEHVVGGYAKADVNVELDPPPLQIKKAMANNFITKYVEPDEDYYGLSVVSIPPINLEYKENVYPTKNTQYIYPSEPESKADLVMGSFEDLPYTTDMDLSSLENGSSYVLNVYIVKRRTTIHEVFQWDSLTGAGVKIGDNSYIYTFILAENNKITIESSDETDNERFIIHIYKFNEYYVGLDGVEIEPIKLTDLKVYPDTKYKRYGAPISMPIQSIITETTTISEPYTVSIDASLMPSGMDCFIFGSGQQLPGGEFTRVLNARFKVPETYGDLTQTFHFDQDSQEVSIAFWTDSSHHAVTISPGQLQIYSLGISEYLADGYDLVTVNPIKTTDLNVTPTKNTQYFSPDGSLIENIISESMVISTPYTVQLDATVLSEGTDCDLVGLSESGGEMSDSLYDGRFVVPSSTADAKYKKNYFYFTQTGRIVTIDFWTDSTHHTITVDPSQYAIYELYIQEHGNDGYDYVEVAPIPDDYIIPSGTSTITSNGIYDVTSFASATVNVSGDTGNEDAIIEKTLSGYYENSRVTNVGSYAFYFNRSLTSVSFPNAQSVYTYAFYGCSNLRAVDFSTASIIGQNCFSNCSLLQSANFPLVTDIEGYAFAECGQLSSINIENATEIGAHAFTNCYSLSQMYLSKVSKIGGYAFNNCGLTDVSFQNASLIGSCAFSTCTSLSYAYFPNVARVSNGVFYSCYNLSSIVFDKIAYLGASAFCSCSALVSINMPFVSFVGGSAFANCASLSKVSFNALSSVSQYAFYNCFALTEIYAPNMSYINQMAFTKCSSLSKITFPKCSYMAPGVFSGNTNLSYVMIGYGDISGSCYIGNNAFYSCSNLMSLFLLHSSTYSIGGTGVFSSTPMSLSSLTGDFGSIYVRESLYSTYISMPYWSAYSLRFVSLTDSDIESWINNLHPTTSDLYFKQVYDSDCGGSGTLVGTIDATKLKNGARYGIVVSTGYVGSSGTVQYQTENLTDSFIYSEATTSYQFVVGNVSYIQFDLTNGEIRNYTKDSDVINIIFFEFEE